MHIPQYLAKPKSRWNDNIEMDVREIGCDDVDWIGLDQHRNQWRASVITVMSLRFS
jgi:hypothetical protein